ncbi:hypothetical protein BSL78_23284 [Apostichopus japonicus]|uniref:EGF-like domain-containing protein n=1 Tax=Stichopus japonicus TaxID=307972 RepID=A0A2G8JVT0_STIJA|nr:hypothetical protein BSL78_23284 [Apostichopus japonicus]
MGVNGRDLFEEVLRWIRSIDPNDIIGPTGFGDARFIAADDTLEYRIRFENMANATAPAQRVTVDTFLDDDVDIATFRLGNFGFGNFTFESGSTSSLLQTTLQFDDDREYVVRVTAGLDFVNRRVTWELQTLNPNTGQPPVDPGIGFLPPNMENGTDGEGFVTYSVRPRSSSKTYDVIQAEARIVFDNNDPIDTEAIFNTIDRDSPVVTNISVVDDVISSGILALSFELNDVGAGVKTTNIYSDNDGKLNFLKSCASNERTVVLDVPSGATYKLVLQPEDNVGNFRSAARGASSLTVVFPFAEVSCAGVNNCSGAGNCTSNNLCQCIEGRYGDDCSQDTPPKEPPIIGFSPAFGVEDMPFQFPLVVQLVNPTLNDDIELRLENLAGLFEANIGEELGEGAAWIIPTEQAQNLVLTPIPDISGEITVTVNATVTDADGVTVFRSVDVPVSITPEADLPILTIEETCFKISGGNSSATVVIDVASGDEDYSEIISLLISGRFRLCLILIFDDIE